MRRCVCVCERGAWMAEELWADDEIICTNLAEQEIASLLNCTWHLSKHELCAAWLPVFSRNSKYEQWWLHLTNNLLSANVCCLQRSSFLVNLRVRTFLRTCCGTFLKVDVSLQVRTIKTPSTYYMEFAGGHLNLWHTIFHWLTDHFIRVGWNHQCNMRTLISMVCVICTAYMNYCLTLQLRKRPVHI